MNFSPNMRNSSFLKWMLILPSALCAGSAWLIGCGGGASSPTDVVIRPTTKPGEVVVTKKNGPDNGVKPEGVGTLSGKITFEGSRPTLPPIVTSAAVKPQDAAVCLADKIPNEKLFIGPDGGLQNVVIYLERAPAGAEIPAPPDEAAIFDQKFCVFLPHVKVFRTNHEIRVLNDDAIVHNTHTYPLRNEPFNFAITPNDRTGLKLVYTAAERAPIEVKCDLHAWMLAYHLPLDHPFAAVTAADGTFTIEDLPAGTHGFQVWHEAAPGNRFLAQKHSVTINKDETTTLNLSFQAGNFNLAGIGQQPLKSVVLSTLP